MSKILAQVDTVKALRQRVARWRREKLKVALVPTMGALHEGHLTLVDHANTLADRIVVSIFINPAQFAAGEDLTTYPRDLEGDLKKLSARKANLAFVPMGEEMYPKGFATSVSVKGPATAALEDKHRPHFFTGVATVVAKLLIQARADYAVFGEKDYQQLKTVTRLAADLDIATRIVGAETIRHDDGLAMSSRNEYLSEYERVVAPLLYKTLQETAEELRSGAEPAACMRRAFRALNKASFKVDYVEARNADSLRKLIGTTDEPIRLLAAAYLGKTRLIDNIAV
ncbi:MAG: pantoate--beta-alanine ligase [Alphaproteobacteria bacterium]|nr:pantoate--beta-alanine ligase [Alphaproteobacteria bacterium]